MTDIKRPPDKRPVGAPKKMTDGKRTNIYIDKNGSEIAARISKLIDGKANISEGIRESLIFWEEHHPKPGAGDPQNS